MKDWEWIKVNLMPTLQSFENEDEITDFVRCKIESLLAQSATESNNMERIDYIESQNFKIAAHKFAKFFKMPEEEKLVNCKISRNKFYFNNLILYVDYSCSYWHGRMPRQGWLYLSVNHLCFYSYLFGKEIKLVIKWADVQVFEKT